MLADDALVWIDGGLVPVAEARIHVADHGLVVGDGAFETLQVVRGVPFAMRRHIRRLHTTLAALAIPAPPEADVRRALTAVCEANAAQTGKVRLTVTGGLGPLGSGEPFGPATMVAAVEPIGAVNRRIVTVPWTRNEAGALSGLKTTSYAENVRALRYAHDHGASEAIFANTRGELCEGTGSNVFVVVDGRLATPPLSSGCLAGITRQILLELVDAEEVALPLDVLETADEIFLVSTTRDVQPVEQADERRVEAGPITAAASAAFADVLATNLDP